MTTSLIELNELTIPLRLQKEGKFWYEKEQHTEKTFEMLLEEDNIDIEQEDKSANLMSSTQFFAGQGMLDNNLEEFKAKEEIG